jgi:hypothetical protein
MILVGNALNNNRGDRLPNHVGVSVDRGKRPGFARCIAKPPGNDMELSVSRMPGVGVVSHYG